MNRIAWAEHEIELRLASSEVKNPGDAERYMAALNAYKALMNGPEFSVSKDILLQLAVGQPLTPITEDDFLSVSPTCDDFYSAEHLKKRNLESIKQCPRYSSLFQYKYLDGTIKYVDTERSICVNVEDSSDTYSSINKNIVDELFPVTLPYFPVMDKYKVYTQTFLTDKAHGDFDTVGILYIVTPLNERIEVNKFRTETSSGDWTDINEEEYKALLKKRIDPVSKKTADSLIFTLISNSGSDDEIKRKEEIWRNLSTDIGDIIYSTLTEKCKFFDKEENWRYNSFKYHQALCGSMFPELGKEIKTISEIPELADISAYLRNVLTKLKLKKW